MPSSGPRARPPAVCAQGAGLLRRQVARPGRDCARVLQGRAERRLVQPRTGDARRVSRRYVEDCGRSNISKAALLRSIRAAFHAHSDWSYDGRLALEEVSALFARHRYDAVFMCEHDRGFSGERLQAYVAHCESASHSGALLVPGIEYADEHDRVHIPVWGDVPFLGEGVPTAQLLHAVAEHDGVSVFAHPRRRDAWQTVDPDWLGLCTGIEVWTRKWDGWAPNQRACEWAADAGLVGVT